MQALRRSTVALVAAALTLAAAPLSAVLPIKSYATLGDPEELVTGVNGTLYWAEHDANAIGYRTPSGTIGHVAIPEPLGPVWITAGSDGTIWFTGTQHKIGRYDPYAPIFMSTMTVFDVPDSKGICQGGDGNIWFTDCSANKVGRITPTGALLEFPVPTAGACPSDITPGPDGSLYFTEPLANKVGRITTGGTIHEEDVGPGSLDQITLGPDGAVWFTKSDVYEIGRLARSRSGVYTLTEFPIPTYASAIVAGPDGAVWYLGYKPGGGPYLGRISTSGSVAECPLEDNDGAYYGITTGVDGAVWLTSYGGYLWRVSLAADVNRDLTLDVLDVFYLINCLFAEGPPPP